MRTPPAVEPPHTRAPHDRNGRHALGSQDLRVDSIAQILAAAIDLLVAKSGCQPASSEPFAQRWFPDSAGRGWLELGESSRSGAPVMGLDVARSAGEGRDDRDRRIGRQGREGVGGRRGLTAAVHAAGRNPDRLRALIDRKAGSHRSERAILRGLGVAEERVYLDHGLTGTNRSRPGLNKALAALREGDTLVVPKLDRLARSVPDARAIGDSLAARGVRLSLGGSVYDPADPMGKCFFNILATFAEFEVECCGCVPAKEWRSVRAKGRLKGKAPKLSRTQRRSCSSSTPMESTRSLSWPNCSPSAAPPSTARSRGRPPRTRLLAFAEGSQVRPYPSVRMCCL